MSLYRSNSLNTLKIDTNTKTPKYNKIKLSNLSPEIVSSKKHYLHNNNTNSPNNKILNLITSRTSRYSNEYIFMKREIVFNKSLEENRKTFKYIKYNVFDRNKRVVNNKKRNYKKNFAEKKALSLYLTENIIKNNQAMFPLLKRDNSSTIIIDNNIELFNNKKNTIFNDYNNFGRKRKKNNLKIINDNLLLKTFNVKKRKEDITLDINKSKRNNNIFNKTKIFELCRNKELTNLKYIDNLKDYITMKMKLD